MILVVNCGSNKTRFITQIVDDFMDVEEVGILELDKADLSKYVGIIISGAPILVTEVDIAKYLDQVQKLVDTQKPLLGICFGHQLIGIHFGAIASRINPINDLNEISVLSDSALFNRLPNEISMMEDHCEAISVPQGFELLATSDGCVNEAMMKKDQVIYGVQFHPEVSGNHGVIIMDNFIRICQSENKPKA